MNYNQLVLSKMRKAIEEYNMIQPNDKIAVGVSGGKDSLTLLKCLNDYSKFSLVKFSVVGITIDMFNEGHYDKIKEWCELENIEYHIVPSNIYDIVFNIRKEKNPCSLCSKLRRGILNTTAISLNCNKVALGHTLDDITDTFLLSLIYEGRLNSFAPVTYLSRTDMTVIRPLMYTEEELTRKVASKLPVVTSHCPADKHTKREYVKVLLSKLEESTPGATKNITNAIIHPNRFNLSKQFDIDKIKRD